MYTLLLPTMVQTGFVDDSIMNKGPFGVSALRPYPFLRLEQLDTFSHRIFWSLLLSYLSLVLVSFFSRQSSKERNQAEVFVDIFKYSTIVDSSIVWKGTAYVGEIKQLISKFLGRPSEEAAFREFGKRHNINWERMEEADYRIVNFAEKLLSGAIGTASARVMLPSVVKEEDITYDDVFYILQESRELISANKSLKTKSRELQEATAKLRITNAKLKKLGRLKDEFISTVTHEM